MQHLRTLVDLGRRALSFLAGPGRTWAMIATAASLPLLLFGGWVGYLDAIQTRARTSREATAAVDVVAGRVAAELNSQLALVRRLADSTTLDRPDAGNFRVEVDRAWAVLPVWGTVILARPSGDPLLTLVRPGGDEPDLGAERPGLEQVASARKADVGGIGPAGPGSSRQRVTVRAPVIRDDHVVGVVSVALVPDGIAALLRRAGARDHWVGLVLDGTGRTVARIPGPSRDRGQLADPSLRSAISAASQGVLRERTRDGVPIETAYEKLPGADGWTVAFGIPLAELEAPVRRALVMLAGEGLVGLLLAAFLAFLVARDLAQRRIHEADLANRSLRASEEGRLLAVDVAELGVWRWAVAEDAFDGSPRTLELLGLSAPARGRKRLSWEEAAAAVQAGDREGLRRAVERCLRQGVGIDGEYRLDGGEGRRWIRLTGRTLAGDPDRPMLLHGVVADITERKRAEADRLDLLRRMALAQEDERRRIAQELHDQVGQAVTGLSLGLKSLETALVGPAASSAVRERIAWLQKLVAEIGQDIHRAAVDLRPAALDDFGLPSALDALAATVGERHGIAVDVQVVGAARRVPPDVEMVVYRVVQEALTNMVKHARAGVASVLLEPRAHSLRLIVEDDGVGFDPAAEVANRQLRMGLSGMRERLRLVNGTIQIESAPGAGTTLFIEIPLQPEVPA